MKNDIAKKKIPAEELLDGIRAVIFDLDGTLIDSMWMWKQIDIDYLASKGKPFPPNLQDTISGMSFSATVANNPENGRNRMAGTSLNIPWMLATPPESRGMVQRVSDITPVYLRMVKTTIMRVAAKIL